VLLADAYETAQKTRGSGEAEAIAIYAQALQQDPEFYAFSRPLESYSKIIREGDTLVLPSDSDLFAYLTSSRGASTMPSQGSAVAGGINP